MTASSFVNTDKKQNIKYVVNKILKVKYAQICICCFLKTDAAVFFTSPAEGAKNLLEITWSSLVQCAGTSMFKMNIIL